ncbi:MAG TPA: hypothetical protein VF815_47055 [Myxococcaceae bacterium]
MSRLSVVVVLTVSLYAGTAAAEDKKPPPPSSQKSEPATEKSPRPKLSAEDQEVVENLELLESMGEAEDLEMLMELSKEEEDH